MAMCTDTGADREITAAEEKFKLSPAQIAGTFFGLLHQLDKDDDDEISQAELEQYFMGLADANDATMFTRRVLRPLRAMAARSFLHPRLRRGEFGETWDGR